MGYAKAQYNLGIALLQGKGVSRDPEDAARWLTTSAGAGCAQARYNLGLLYLQGLGVDVPASSLLRPVRPSEAP